MAKTHEKITHSKISHHYILVLLFLFLLVFVSTVAVGSSGGHFQKPSTEMAAGRRFSSRGRTLFSETVDFHSRKNGKFKQSKGSEFQGRKHEVPNGPNPISNR
ncbi:hypothetical protein OROMI_029557 [Orobanche minor]